MDYILGKIRKNFSCLFHLFHCHVTVVRAVTAAADVTDHTAANVDKTFNKPLNFYWQRKMPEKVFLIKNLNYIRQYS